MRSRANVTIYWPGMSAGITNTRLTCRGCTENAPSQSAEPLVVTPFPEWPFQKICADYFSIDQYGYLVIADRYSGWISVYYFRPGEATSTTLIEIFRHIFMDYGVAEEVSSDGGPQFKSESLKNFFSKWGVAHRRSSADYPQSNGRAEVAVKSAKRIIHDNSNSDGSLNNDATVQAILQYRNTPLQDCGLSPAQIVFHRQLKDSIPCHPSKYQLHPEWILAAKEREHAYHKKNDAVAEAYNKHTKALKPLDTGTQVVIQGKDGKWSKQGQVVEKLDNRQYRVKVLGSGRITLRNRRFLRQCYHTRPNQPMLTPDASSRIRETSPNSEDIVVTPTKISEPESPKPRRVSFSEPLCEQNPEISQAQASASTNSQVTAQTPVPKSKRMPLALRNLQPYNRPGRKGLPGE